MKDVDLKLTIAEVQLVINALSEAPHKLVHELIPKIAEQANGQAKGHGDEVG